MNYTDAQLEAMAEEYAHGIPDDHQEGTWQPGPYAWLLDITDDLEALTAQARKENLSLTDLVHKAVTTYLNNNQAA